MKEQVHIVMAAYNGEKYIREQLDSLLAQTYKNITIEVCDDGSTDATASIIREYESRDERVKLHANRQNKGYVKNFLEGIRRCQAPYVMLCDQDDIWQDDKVEQTLHAMQQTEKEMPGKPVLIFTDAICFDSETGKELGLFHEMAHLDVKKVDTAHLFMENKCIGCTMMMNRAILPYLEELPAEIRVHDWWLALICSHFGAIRYVPQVTLRYRQHEGNQIGGASYTGYLKKRLAHIREQRTSLVSTYRQGAAFLRIFGEQMDRQQRLVAEQFAGMEQAGFLGRRYRVVRYGFKKSGWIRNIGLFLLV